MHQKLDQISGKTFFFGLSVTQKCFFSYKLPVPVLSFTKDDKHIFLAPECFSKLTSSKVNSRSTERGRHCELTAATALDRQWAVPSFRSVTSSLKMTLVIVLSRLGSSHSEVLDMESKFICESLTFLFFGSSIALIALVVILGLTIVNILLELRISA